MAETETPSYGPGDPVGWFAGPGHGAGTGIITSIERLGDPTEYKVHKLIGGERTGVELVVAETLLYPIRALKDERPQPYIQRHSRGSHSS
ncbi:MAG TPA: hypothetical protein VFS20_14430 [Longimicrobium sp.]|nr:hypothetical protein [Longimicrobium sp.]